MDEALKIKFAAILCRGLPCPNAPWAKIPESTEEEVEELIRENDAGNVSFAEIADYIEAHWKD